MKGKILGFFITIIFSALLFFSGMESHDLSNPMEAYQVYINGKKIGMIESKDKLYDMIDNEQIEIKNKYKVNKVYPPHGIEIKKVYTYDNDIVDINKIYEQIKDIDPFTIEAYKVTIKYNSDKMADEEEEEEVTTREDITLYLMDKQLIKKALYNTAAAFISTEDLQNYENNTQIEIEDTGEIITSVLFDETITIKKDLVSVEEKIFEDESELSRYLLFGTLEEQQSYTVQEGENLYTIAENHRLNVEELLIANPKYPSANVLLTAGEDINVGLINPLVSVVYKKTIVEDISVAYQEELVRDPEKPASYSIVQQEGKNGTTRITQDVTYINGEVKFLDIVSQEELVPSVTKILLQGTKGTNSFEFDPTTSSQWSWPTKIPFKIVSGYKWRWGRMHQGIDIAGCGYGSPIYAVGDGVAYKFNRIATKAEGISIRIEHGNTGYSTIYMHLSKILIKEGAEVKKGDLIGEMGCTGRCYGTHLHLGVYIGRPYEGGVSVDPCKTLFSC